MRSGAFGYCRGLVKRWLPVIVAVVATAAAVAFASLYFTKGSEPTPVAAQPCGDRLFGHIRSLVRRGDQYELRFDPAFWLSGVTANTAAAEDGSVAPGEPVPNDYYLVDESRRTLKYLVRPGASVTVLVNNGTGILSTPISVSELAEIVKTGESSRRKLFEPLESGVWIRTRIDTACALDQQYRP
jgi:hypothetical protein